MISMMLIERLKGEPYTYRNTVPGFVPRRFVQLFPEWVCRLYPLTNEQSPQTTKLTKKYNLPSWSIVGTMSPHGKD